MLLREEGPKRLDELGISLESIRAILESRLPKYDLVRTGYSSYVEDCKNTEAFGLYGGFTVFVSYNPAGIVNALWCSPWGIAKDYLQDSKNPLLEVFGILSAQFELLFVDWGWCRMFKLNDQHVIEEYLEEHIRQLETNK